LGGNISAGGFSQTPWSRRGGNYSSQFFSAEKGEESAGEHFPSCKREESAGKTQNVIKKDRTRYYSSNGKHPIIRNQKRGLQ